MSEPKVSVIIACRNARGTIARCLDSLERQQTGLRYEVIVADSSTDGTDRIIAERYGWVRLLHFEERKWPGDARNAALEVARGEIIGFLDADCEAEQGWLEAMAGAVEGWAGSVGGEVRQAEPAGLTAWAAYFCEFSHWMPGGQAGSIFEVPTCNMGIRRVVMREVGPFLEGVYCSDSEFHWRMKKMGRGSRFVPEMRVAHMTEGGWSVVVGHEYFHGRSYGQMRARRGGMGAGELWLMRSMGWMLPVLVAAKTVARVASRGKYGGQLWRSLPLLLLASGAWGMGELAGYWRGERA